MTISLEAARAFLYREARLLDDRAWDEWLTCYAPDVTYWMPAWDDDDRLTEDPQSQISLIYYPDRDGLEDRIFRIKTERSGGEDSGITQQGVQQGHSTLSAERPHNLTPCLGRSPRASLQHAA